MIRTLVLLIVTCLLATGCDRNGPGDLTIAVMDPLAADLSCACVAGYAQRDYRPLASDLRAKMGCPVKLIFADSLDSARKELGVSPDVVIGKDSVVRADAKKAELPYQAVAALTGLEGKTTLTGLFVVREDDPIQSLWQLKAKDVIIFGPVESVEKQAAARPMLDAAISVPLESRVMDTCSLSAQAVANSEARLAVISSYALPILLGCETIDPGTLRVLTETKPVPFIRVFVRKNFPKGQQKRLIDALRAVRENPALKKALETRDGFVDLAPKAAATKNAPAIWADWRGPHRAGQTKAVPMHLPKQAKFRWRIPLTGQSLGGVSATHDCVIVSDKFADLEDIWRCLDAKTGQERWAVRYAAPGLMDYTSAPRANPVIREGRVYLLGAMGDLHCVQLDTGKILWKCSLIETFGGSVPTWGFCGSPLLVDDKVIVATAGKDAALVALDAKTGKTLWKTPGRSPGYGSLLLGMFGGRRQIVGFDAKALVGWDPDTGQKLWDVLPEQEGDFNVGTPLAIGKNLLVATENNGARLFAFDLDKKGLIRPKPIATSMALTPDTSTPVLTGSGDQKSLWGVGLDGLVCLDVSENRPKKETGLLPTLWQNENAPFNDYASLIASETQVLLLTLNGELVLLPARPERDTKPTFLQILAKNSSDDAFDPEFWSAPALVGNTLFLRTQNELLCLILK